MVAVAPGDVGRISRAAVSYNRNGRGVPETLGTGVAGQLCMVPTINRPAREPDLTQIM